jgi:peptidoglycan/LPS O-acetylase OafA/YrhL
MGADRPLYPYRPALDGVRGLAVSAVVLFHGGVATVPGGFLGVDTFFVLSGFLITSLLLAEYDREGRIRLLAFWGRRARRLLPALLVMLAVVTVAGRWLLAPDDERLLRGDALAALGYVANWRMIYRGAGYFTQTAAPSVLQHTWSLGIEEQFYLVWPLAVAGVLGLSAGRRRVVIATCLAGIAASVGAAALLYRPDDVNRAYFGTDTRAQALLIGCALAVVAPKLTHRFVTAPLAVAGALGTVWLWSHADGSAAWLYRGGFTAAALATGAVLVHAVTQPASVTARLLSRPPLVWLGKISYGVYLWHWPLFQYLSGERLGFAGGRLLALRCAATLAVAVASYWLVERPIRRQLRRPRSLPRRLSPVVTLGAVAACALTVLWATVPAVSATSGAATAGAATAGSASNSGPSEAPPAKSTPPPQPGGRLPGGPPRIDILGDSVAWTIGAYLPPHPGITVNDRAIQGCGITLQMNILELGTPHRLYPYCPSWPQRWKAAVDTDRPDVSVILLNRWELMDAKVGGSYEHVGQPAFDAYLIGQLEQAIGIAGSDGARVVLLTASYTRRAERPDGGLYPEDDPSRVDAWNALLRRAPATVLDLAKLTCPGGTFTWTVDGVKIRSDGLHFTPAGVKRIIAPWLLPQLTAIA